MKKTKQLLMLILISTISVALLTGCSKNNTSKNKVETNRTTTETQTNYSNKISTEDLILNNYWVEIDSDGYNTYYNFNNDSVIKYNEVGPSDISLDIIENIDFSDNTTTFYGDFYDDFGSVKIKYEASIKDENTILLTYRFNLEGDTKTYRSILNIISLDDIISNIKNYYSSQSDVDSVIDYFTQTDLNIDYEQNNQTSYITTDDAINLVFEYYEDMNGQYSCDKNWIDVSTDEYNGNFGYYATYSNDAPFIFRNGIGLLFVDGATGEITVIE